MIKQLFCTAVLLSVCLGGLIYIIHNLMTYGYENLAFVNTLLYYVLPAIIVLVLIWVYRLPVPRRLNASIAVFSLLLSLYCAEIILTFFSPHYFFFRDGVKIDSRTKLEVIADLRNRGESAYPFFQPYWFVKEPKPKRRDNNHEFMPLGSISNALSVHCSESGIYTIYRTDEHGFNNRHGTWHSKINIALIGDSFAQGSCVMPEQNIAGILLQKYSGVLNLGMAGNGPLSELATLSEYLPDKKPKYVIWLYFERNDFNELQDEKLDPILTRYLTEGYRQGLIDLQEQSDQYMKQVIDSDPELQATIRNISGFGPVLKLREIRARLHQFLLSWSHSENDPNRHGLDLTDHPDIHLFSHILALAKARVEHWGGEMIFVYLPAWQSFEVGKIGNPYRSEVLNVVNDLNLKMVDFQEILLKTGDPFNYFPFRRPGHYSANGYKKLADSISNVISAHYENPGNLK